jgi:hypothetical protein
MLRSLAKLNETFVAASQRPRRPELTLTLRGGPAL